MRSIQRNIACVFLTVALNLCVLTVSAQQQPGVLRGRVIDEGSVAGITLRRERSLAPFLYAAI
jgi:hypothetical protein